jgi:peptidoglycan hydrolase CwlO-like protein
LISIFVSPVMAQDCDGIGDVYERISCYQEVLNDLGNQGKTLKSQISSFDAQINLTSLEIEQTEEKINLLSGRIDQLEGSLDTLTDAFSQRAIETYKMARVGDPVLLIVTSEDLSEAVSRFFYLKKIQEADRDLLERLTTAQNTYKGEKLDQEELQTELEKQKATLNSQKAAKKALLDQTQNDEKKYQTLLAQALAEKAAIENALASGVEVGPVKQGDPIALVGNSGYPGCSTGKHLHFEVRKNGSWTDPTPYLQNKSVQDEQNGGTTSIGSGGWPWPIQDTIRLTQHYGVTPYSWRYSYSGGIHTGLDMVSTSSDVIRAPADGNLYKSSQSCGSSSVINIVYIEHSDGVITFYLHVQ